MTDFVINQLTDYDPLLTVDHWLHAADHILSLLGSTFDCAHTRGFVAIDPDDNRYLNCRLKLEPLDVHSAARPSFEGVLYIGNGREPNRQRDQSIALVILFPFLFGTRISPWAGRDYYLESHFQSDSVWTQPTWSLDDCMEWNSVGKRGDLFQPC